MTPTIGRTVIYVQGTNEESANGTREHPAVITRVWNDKGVNLLVFFDAHAPEPRTSVLRDDTAGPDMPYWHWPQRIAESAPAPEGEKAPTAETETAGATGTD